MEYLCSFKHVEMLTIFTNYNFLYISYIFYEIRGREVTTSYQYVVQDLVNRVFNIMYGGGGGGKLLCEIEGRIEAEGV
jgi:hypothetical protein